MSQILGVNDPYVIPGTIGGGGGASLPEDSAGYLYNDGSGNLSYDSALTNLGSPLTLSRTANDANGFQINMVQRRGSGVAGQDNDVLGTISFKGYDDKATPELTEYARISASIADASDATEDGKLALSVMANGTLHSALEINSVGTDGTYYNFIAPTSSVARVKIGSSGVNSVGSLWVDTFGGTPEISFTLNAFGSYAFQMMHNAGNAATYFYDTAGGMGNVLTVKSKALAFFAGPTDTVIGATGASIVSYKNVSTAPTAIVADFVQTWCADYAAGDARLYLMGEKNTNTLALGAGNVHFSPTTMADDSVSGETFTGTAGENLVWGDVVYLKSDGKFWKADFNATTTTPAVAFCTGTINADASGEFLRRGWIRDDSAYDFTFGAQAGTIYLGESGAITQTAPSGSGDQVQVLGWALEADIWYFDPQFVIVEV